MVAFPSTRRGARGRRPPRPSGDERELAILTTCEKLLAERPLSAISVDDLSRGAGISRPTSCCGFASQAAVLLTLLHRGGAAAGAAAPGRRAEWLVPPRRPRRAPGAVPGRSAGHGRSLRPRRPSVPSEG